MGVFGIKSVLIPFLGLLLAVYINYPAPTTVSKHLSTWRTTSSKTRIYNGHRIFYKDEFGRNPKAPVLVCLHGFPTASFDWIKVWPALLDKFSRVIAPDFIGYGLSDKPLDHAYSIMEQASIVENILESHNIKEVHVLAHDYGDTVAQEILARYEDRKSSDTPGLIMRSVCLLNGGIFPETNFPRILQKALLIPYLGAVITHLSNIHTFRRSFGEIFGPDTQPTEEEFQDFWALLRKEDGNLVLDDLLQYIPERSANSDRWTGVLQKSEVPVHNIYGPADPVNPPGFVDFYKKTVREPSIEVLAENIGHYPQWEAPAETMMAYFKFLKTLAFSSTQSSSDSEDEHAKVADIPNVQKPKIAKISQSDKIKQKPTPETDTIKVSVDSKEQKVPQVDTRKNKPVEAPKETSTPTEKATQSGKKKEDVTKMEPKKPSAEIPKQTPKQPEQEKKEDTKMEGEKLTKQTPKPKQEPKQTPKQEPKQEPKQTPKQTPKQEPKQTQKKQEPKPFKETGEKKQFNVKPKQAANKPRRASQESLQPPEGQDFVEMELKRRQTDGKDEPK